MGFFSKLFKGPEIDMEKSDANAKKMRALFHQAVGGGEDYRLIFGYTEDVSRFNYGFVHGSKTKIGNLLVGWNEDSQTIVVVPTVPDLSGCGEPVYYRRSEILKAYRPGKLHLGPEEFPERGPDAGGAQPSRHRQNPVLCGRRAAGKGQVRHGQECRRQLDLPGAGRLQRTVSARLYACHER